MMNKQKLECYCLNASIHTVNIKSMEQPNVPPTASLKVVSCAYMSRTKTWHTQLNLNKINGDLMAYSEFMAVFGQVIGALKLNAPTFYRTDIRLDSYIDNFNEYCNDVMTETIPIISQTAEINLTNAKAKIGSTVDISVNIVDNPGIASAKMQINYDTNAMTLKKVTDAGLLGSTAHSPALTSPYTLYWNNGSVKENYTVNGQIATLTFEIKSNAVKGIYPISIDFTDDDILDVDMNSVSFEPSDGFIEITDNMIGDMNSDGKINVKDNMIFSRFIAEWPDYTIETVNTAVADLNSDGKINVRDDMILSRHIAEWPGYETLPYLN